jgi:hypothetical protein
MQFDLYEAGDMVQTPDGKAMVIEDQRLGSTMISVELIDSQGTKVYPANSIALMQSA